MIAKHIRKHWAHHLALWGILIAASLSVAGAAAVHQFQGGYRPAPLPPPIHESGVALPPSWSLERYIVRIHDQGQSNSCVGQTVSTIEEITWQERTHGNIGFSSGFIWNQLNGGADQGITYEAAFGLLEHEGDATLSAFPPDGATDKFVQPSPDVVLGAHAHRARSWASIDPGDRTTMETELKAGRPLALALPMTDSSVNQWGLSSLPVISSQSGSFLFWHSVTGIGYTPQGVEILNSWGDGWGFGGKAILSWGFLQAVNAGIVISSPLIQPVTWPPHPPAPPTPGPSPTPKPTPRPTFHFPWKAWNGFRAAYGLRAIGVWSGHRLTPEAQLWYHNRWLGPVISGPRPHPAGHYQTTEFVHGIITTWPDWKASIATKG